MGQIAVATGARHAGADVIGSWKQVLDLWEEWMEAERQEALQGLVQEVRVEEKDCVHLRLTPIVTVHSHFIVNTEPMGAPRKVFTMNPLPNQQPIELDYRIIRPKRTREVVMVPHGVAVG